LARTLERIGVDFHVVDGKFQGTRSHLIELYSRVIRDSPEIEFFLYLDRPGDLLEISPAFGLPNVQRRRMPATSSVKRLYWDLPILTRRDNVDLIHTQYILPGFAHGRRAVTIHDVLFEIHPEFFTPLFVQRSRVLMKYAARNADQVYTVSEFSRREIARHYKIPIERITVIYNGVAYEKFAAEGQHDEGVLAKRALSRGDYLLSVGRLEPRKNHISLLKAYALLKEDAPPLVIVGQRDFKFAGIFDVLAELRLGNRVRILEDVSDSELPVLYRNAALFAYPAIAEGFGMPMLEAMAAGTPVVASDRAAIPEVAGERGALLIDPFSPNQIADAMERILTDLQLRTDLIQSGRERARHFSWESSAQTLRQRYVQG
jgi:glycosyltransferase involved in cell wall biosynthesis